MTKAEVTRASKLRAKGLTYAAIAEKLGVSDSTVRRWLNKPCSTHDKPRILVEHCLASESLGRKHPHQVTTAKLQRDVARIEEAEAEVFEALEPPKKRGKIAQWWHDFKKSFLEFDDEEPAL